MRTQTEHTACRAPLHACFVAPRDEEPSVTVTPAFIIRLGWFSAMRLGTLNKRMDLRSEYYADVVKLDDAVDINDENDC